jgi:hypothetical protein
VEKVCEAVSKAVGLFVLACVRVKSTETDFDLPSIPSVHLNVQAEAVTVAAEIPLVVGEGGGVGVTTS